MTRKERELFLTQYAEKELEDLLDMGSKWFYNAFLPNLEIATNTKSVDEGILAVNWSMAGDIFDLVFAPMQAKYAYQKALELEPEFAAVYLQMASIHNDLGDYEAATDYINDALELEPEDEDIALELERIKINQADKSPALYSESNVKWPFYETLAARKVEELTAMCKDGNNPFHSKIMAFEANIQENLTETQNYWSKFLSKTPEHQLNFVEEFYLR
jgi:tetratricopeptide (TPR) repeat protein